jgi:heterodisulfide reductase subunit C
MRRLTGAPAERTFLHEVIEASGQDLLTCLQCGKCSGGCPIASEEVGGPRKAIAAILGGMKDEALKDPTWWYCVSCGTCATRCPVEINFYQVATTLCEMAEKAGLKPSEPAIHRFEEMFLESVRRHGRVQEVKTAMLFNLRSGQPFKDAAKGMQLMLKGAISPKDMMGGASHGKTQVTRIFDRAHQAAKEGR